MSPGSGTRALGSSDVVFLLAKYLTKPGLLRLSRTSKSCFIAIAGLIWSEIRGIHRLLRLVPSVISLLDKNGRPYKRTIPDLRFSDLTRFGFYAALVYRLHILPEDYAVYDQAINHERLLQYSYSRVLLPNLRSITCDSGFQNATPSSCIIPFLSPTVVKLHFNRDSGPYMSPEVTFSLLKLLSERTPDIQEFSIFSNADGASLGAEDEGPEETSKQISIWNHDSGNGGDYDMDHTENYDWNNCWGYDPHSNRDTNGDNNRDTGHNHLDENHLIKHYLWPETIGKRSGIGAHPFSCYEHTKGLGNLQYLTTTPFVLNKRGLEALGSLPHLKGITVYYLYAGECAGSGISPQCRDNPFPSLRSLRLSLPGIASIQHIWKQHPFIRRLNEVKIKSRRDISHTDDLSPRPLYDKTHGEKLALFIQDMCIRNPNIKKFTLDFDPPPGQVELVTTETLQTLATLPLTALDLRGVELEDIPAAYQVLSQCRSLREIHLHKQKLSSLDFIHFGLLPFLERLHANIKWEWIILNGPPQTRSNIRQLLCGTEPEFHNQLGLTLVARSLATTFPKLDSVFLLKKPSDSAELDYRTAHTFLTHAIRNHW